MLLHRLAWASRHSIAVAHPPASSDRSEEGRAATQGCSRRAGDPMDARSRRHVCSFDAGPVEWCPPMNLVWTKGRDVNS